MSSDSFRKIANTVVDSSSVSTPINANIVSVALPATFNVILTLTDVDLKQLPRGGTPILLDVSGMTGNRSLTLGADTATNARNLQNILGLTHVDDQILLTFINAGANISGFNCLLANTSSPPTFANVAILLNGVTTAASQVLTNTAVALAGNMATGVAYVVATATNVTSGSEVIQFNIISQIRSSTA